MKSKKDNCFKKENGYSVSRYNSLNHGVLSRLKVLPWENSEELEEIQQSFLDEHQPKGDTEKYLVLELANIVFRRARLYQAESALVCKELEGLSGYSFEYVAKAAKFLSEEDCQKRTYKNNDTLGNSIYHDLKSDGETIEYFEKQIKLIENLICLDLSYEQMLEKLDPYLLEVWENYEGKYENNKDGLVLFLKEKVIEPSQNKIESIKARPYVKQHAIACSYIPDQKMETLQRYETGLDRRFERILGMLLKLQSIRQERMTLALTVPPT